VRMVVSELRGEKIDIIPHNDEPARFVAKALSPARVKEVLVDDDARQATVIVPDDQLSLAIGREGQNARLAARLTGWRIDIKSESEFANEGDEVDQLGDEEESGGRCAAVLSNGRRCPNASLPGSNFCGLTVHQALSRIPGTNHVSALITMTDDDLDVLADPDATEEQYGPLVDRAVATAEADAAAALALAAEEVIEEDVALQEAALDEIAAVEEEVAEHVAAGTATEEEIEAAAGVIAADEEAIVEAEIEIETVEAVAEAAVAEAVEDLAAVEEATDEGAAS